MLATDLHEENRFSILHPLYSVFELDYMHSAVVIVSAQLFLKDPSKLKFDASHYVV